MSIVKKESTGLLFCLLLLGALASEIIALNVVSGSNAENDPTETRHMLYETQVVNGLNASELEANPIPSPYSVKHTIGWRYAGWTIYWGIRVWMRLGNGSEIEITAGAPVAVVSRYGNNYQYELQNASWDCPQTALDETDSIVVRVYETHGDANPWESIANFTTEQLDANQLGSARWTVYYYTQWYQALMDDVTFTFGAFSWGYDFPSRIANFQYSKMAMYLVVRGSDNRIYYRNYNSTSASWFGWNSLPTGTTLDSPAAVCADNILHIVVRGASNDQIWYSNVNLTDNTFSGWTQLSGATPSTPMLTGNSTTLSLVVRGENNNIYYRFYTIASQTWTGWTAVPSGTTPDAPAASLVGNTLHIVVRGSDGTTLWYSNVDLSTGAFSGWQLVGGATQSKPTLIACEARNEIILVVRGLNNVIYRNAWNGSSWAGWSGLPTGATCDGIGATVIGEALHVVVRGMDGYTLWHSCVDLATSAFSGWTPLSGSTPSTPTLTS